MIDGRSGIEQNLMIWRRADTFYVTKSMGSDSDQ